MAKLSQKHWNWVKNWALIWSAFISIFLHFNWVTETTRTGLLIDSLARYSLKAQVLDALVHFSTDWGSRRFRDKRMACLDCSRHSLRTMHILRMVSVLLDFRCSLAIDASATTKCSCHISQGASLNSILFASFTTQQEHRYTWYEACQQATKYSTLV